MLSVLLNVHRKQRHLVLRPNLVALDVSQLLASQPPQAEEFAAYNHLALVVG